jgi:nitroreductase
LYRLPTSANLDGMATSTSSTAARLAALALLATRHSASPKHLVAPGPTEGQLRTAFAVALRAPDHGRLIPFRFVVVRDDGLERLADLFLDYGRRHGKSEVELALERTRAVQAPVVIAVVARIDAAHEVPVHEQWIAVGGALTNVLNALHLLGFGAKMLSGRRAGDAQIVAAFCQTGEQLVGWISCGTATSAPKARGVDDVARIVARF